MNRTPKERRRVRSEDQDIAVEMQLCHVADVLDLKALVLADDMGRSVSSVGNSQLGELLAAMVMWTGFSEDIDEFTVEAVREHDPTIDASHIRSITVVIPGEAEKLQLVGLGRSIVTSIGLAHAAAGIRRIRSGKN